eukprot:jgi/Ulvmu1/2108/UM125_0012.1
MRMLQLQVRSLTAVQGASAATSGTAAATIPIPTPTRTTSTSNPVTTPPDTAAANTCGLLPHRTAMLW